MNSQLQSAQAFLKPLQGKWKLELLRLLSIGPARWCDFVHKLPKATPGALTRQICMLEQTGLIDRRIVIATPPKVVEYTLSSSGLEFVPLLQTMSEWNRVYHEKDSTDLQDCQKLLCGRWLIPILCALEQLQRFGSIQESLPDISRSVLVEQLQYLCELNMITQMRYNVFPPRVEYNMTEKGRAFLNGVFYALPKKIAL